MDFSLGPEVEAFRGEARRLFAQHCEFRDGIYQDCRDDEGVLREMGRRGWLDLEREGSMTWDMKMFVLSEEAERMNVPLKGLAATFIVGFTLSRVGTEEQKQRILPGIAAGTTRVALGYSEPGAGSDIAGTKVRARRDGDEWVINGQKQWTSSAEVADYIWLLTRTDPEAKKHAGLTIFLAPIDTPGITIVPIHTIGGQRTNQVFFDGARIADSWRVGEVNGGWKVLSTALVYEHGGGNVPGRSLSGAIARILDLGLAHVREAGEAACANPDVQEAFGETAIELELTRLLNYRATWIGAQAEKADIPGAVFKLLGRQGAVFASERLLELMGPWGLIREGAGGPENPAVSAIQRQFLATPVGTVAGGSVEIQRTKIAERGLGLPRPPRG